MTCTCPRPTLYCWTRLFLPSGGQVVRAMCYSCYDEIENVEELLATRARERGSRGTRRAAATSTSLFPTSDPTVVVSGEEPASPRPLGPSNLLTVDEAVAELGIRQMDGKKWLADRSLIHVIEGRRKVIAGELAAAVAKEGIPAAPTSVPTTGVSRKQKSGGRTSRGRRPRSLLSVVRDS